MCRKFICEIKFVLFFSNERKLSFCLLNILYKYINECIVIRALFSVMNNQWSSKRTKTYIYKRSYIYTTLSNMINWLSLTTTNSINVSDRTKNTRACFSPLAEFAFIFIIVEMRTCPMERDYYREMLMRLVCAKKYYFSNSPVSKRENFWCIRNVFSFEIVSSQRRNR